MRELIHQEYGGKTGQFDSRIDGRSPMGSGCF
jgi:hypothetical protein